jgi:photosystem II protein
MKYVSSITASFFGGKTTTTPPSSGSAPAHQRIQHRHEAAPRRYLLVLIYFFSAIHETANITYYIKMKFITLLAASLPLAAAFAPNSAFSSSRVSTELDASIQFVKGLEEKVVPDVKLTRAKDGSSGIATFNFNNPNCFDASTASKGEVTGMFLADEEGELTTTDVNAKFSNGKPQSIEATYVMTSPEQWDRFMRFMDRYAETNGLGFNSAK